MIKNKIINNLTQLNLKYNLYTNIFLIHKFSSEQEMLKKTLGFFDIKDNFCIKGIQTSAASNLLKGVFTPNFTSTVVTKLVEKGYVCIGTTNMDEFASGTTGEFSCFGKTLNPWKNPKTKKFDLKIGGSSSGAGASASLISNFSFGTDTGGSVRLPAITCGLAAFKPTYGVISKFGIIEYASSLDTVGFISRTFKEINSAFDILAQKDSYDMTTKIFSKFEKVKTKKEKAVIVNLEGQHNISKLEQDKLLIDLFEYLKKLNISFFLEKENFVNFKTIGEIYTIISSVEFFSNLNHFDSFKFGKSGECRSNYFHKNTIQKILKGSYILGYKPKLYELACEKRLQTKKKLELFLQEYDYLIYVFFHGRNSIESDQNIDDILCLANLSGFPCVSIPISLSEDEMPVSIIVITKINNDKNLLNFSEKMESLINFYKIRTKYIEDENWIRNTLTN